MGAATRQGERKGDFLAGKYLVGDCLGIGGMGEVYRAQNMSLGRNVAVKILNRDFVKNEDDVMRFLREARAAAAVRHPNVVDVLDVARDDDGTPFIVQELLVGEDLETYLRARGGRLKAEEALDILIPIADAVAAAHARDVIHRDLKPANIFLAREGTRTTPKVLDFGACLFPTLGGLSARELRMLIGTPHYMAPEQIISKSDVDARTDVWALGVILYELLVGETPFEAESGSAVLQLVKTRDVPKLSSAVKGVHEAVEKLVFDCTQRDRNKRTASGEAVFERMKDARETLRKGQTRIDTQPEFEPPDLPPILAAAAPIPDLELPASPRRSRKLLTLSEPDVLDEPEPKKDSLPSPAVPTNPPVSPVPMSGRGEGPREVELVEGTEGVDLRLGAEPSWISAKPAETKISSIPPILDTRKQPASVRPPHPSPVPPASARRSSGTMEAAEAPAPQIVPPATTPRPRSGSIPPPATTPRPRSSPSGSMRAVDVVRRASGAMQAVKITTAPAPPASPAAKAKVAALVVFPAVAAFFALKFVPAAAAPLGRAIRGDTTMASGGLAVIVLVIAAVLTWRWVTRSRDRLLLATVVGSWLFGVVMIVQTFAASENEHGMTPTGLGAAPFVAPLAPLAGAMAFVVRALEGLGDGEKRERLLYPLLASFLVFLALALSPIGVALVRP